MADFKSDFEWQRRFLPEIKWILAQHLIVEAPFHEDTQHNTDLMAPPEMMVLELPTMRVACRVRTYGELLKKGYKDEFTIRSSRPSGAKTELYKMLAEGWGDYIFYGFSNQDSTRLTAWLLGNLHAFRVWHSDRISRGLLAGIERSNGDKSSKFRVYQIAEMPSDFQKARQEFATLS